MPLGMEVDLGPGDFVLAGDQKRGTRPNFPPMSIVAKRLYASGYHLVRAGLSLVDIVLDGDSATHPHQFAADVRCGPNVWMD